MNKMELYMYYQKLEEVLRLGKDILKKSDCDEDIMISIDAVNIEINTLKTVIDERLDD
jgi:hypothetical protein